jgi:5-methyltetrahydrofolate--homocysteine methyltransferase
VQRKNAGRPKNESRKLGRAADARVMRPIDVEEIRLRRAELTRGVPVPPPPFWGPQTIARVPVKAIVPYLNERMLYQFQWGYRKEGRSLAEYKAWARTELRPILARISDIAIRENILVPQAAYGYWRCAAQGNDVILFDDSGPGGKEREIARFPFPRQNKEGGLCIADFFRDVDDPERDVIGLQVVTMGRRASEAAREWFADNRYQDYLYLHGLSVEMAEAFAEYVHKRIRGELGFAAEEARDHDEMLNQGYRGSRYSFGYPACPNLADQRLILELLRAEEIGVVLTEEDQLDPEQSTSAIIVHHPQAKYFSV